MELPSARSYAAVAVDVQPGLLRAYPAGKARRVVEAAGFAAAVFRELGVPLALLALDPERLGPVAAELEAAAGPGAARIAKTAYDAWREPVFVRWVEAVGRPWIVLFGIETHVCVLQTGLSLLETGFRVAWLRDATHSRDDMDRDTGERLLERAGALPLTTETLAFATLGGRDHPAFPRLLSLFKQRVEAGRA